MWNFFLRRTDLFEQLALDTLQRIFCTPKLKSEWISHRSQATDFFDVVFCSHVLEHVPDDRKAMREPARVLKPGGWAVIMVPCYLEGGPTFEDFTVTAPAERLKLFGQEDHVRLYGNDFVDRLRESRFEVRVLHASDFMTPDEIIRLSITAFSGDVFLCTKHSRE